MVTFSTTLFFSFGAVWTFPGWLRLDGGSSRPPPPGRPTHGLPTEPPEGSRSTYHAGKQLPIIVAGHPSGAVELKPAVFAGPHTQQARVHLWQRRNTVVSPWGALHANIKGSNKSSS